MEAIKNTFAQCKKEQRSALVTYVTAGYPSAEDTVDILLGMEAGGADLIELGLPFTDPIADGPTIQKANTQALKNGVTVTSTLEMVRSARRKGLKAPVLFMGYYNPLLSYGEEKIMRDAKEAGVNGFIVVDLPPEEAVRFRNFCTKGGLSYVPLIAPATSESRMKLLCKIADSFIYVVSRMGVTGASETLNKALPELLDRVHQYSNNVPAAVGFGVSTRQHFIDVGRIAEGVVIGSQIVITLANAPKGEGPKKVEEYCSEITGRKVSREVTDEVKHIQEKEESMTNGYADHHDQAQPTEVIEQGSRDDGPGLADQLEALNMDNGGVAVPSRFGEFGGQYVPESLMDCLAQLEDGFNQAKEDPKFWEEYRSYYPYMGRPGQLHMSERLTEHASGANIWLKREDLNHTGSHKINNALGQILLARRLGKTRIIAETGAGQHGVATATVCAKFGMACTIYMGAEDVRRQALNVFRIKLLGAKVVAVEAGAQTLRDAVNEAMRAWVVDLDTTHYIIGSAIGPHPFPTIVRTFQSVIGNETKDQMQRLKGKLPDAVVACVGGGSNAVGMFYPFAKDPSVKLLGVEAGGDGVETDRHSATLTGGTKGVLHGVRTYVLQNKHGQISETHSVSAGLDYPGVGPELSSWKDTERAKFIAATDAQAFEGFRLLSELEGIIPALETAHAIWGAVQLAKEMEKGKDIVICLSGRGDKDVQSVAEELPKIGPKIGWDLRSSKMSVTTIDRLTITADEQSKHPIITGFSQVASYNWLDASKSTIVPVYPFSSIDIISDRSPLRKLYAFAANDPNLKDFCFGFSVLLSNGGRKTVVFHRKERMTREIEKGGFYGYRKGFEGQYLRSDDEAKGCTSLYRIVEYAFGGLKFLMRSAVDGCIPAETSAMEKFNVGELDYEKSFPAVPATVEHKDDGDIGKGYGKGKAFEKSAANDADTLSIIPTTNSPPPYHTLLELTTRSKNSKNPFDIASKLPDLYLSQTQHFVEAYCHNPGWRRFEKDALKPGRFVREDVHISRMGGKLREWEEMNGQALGMFRGVL
ncbi:MAG: hypothetical protein Q9215_007330 [Flavoplaca cf. flavocitrina]